MNDKSKAKAKAQAAAVALAASAVRTGATVACSWEHLRALVDMPDVRFVRLIVGDDSWCCKRARLREIRAALRPFRGVLCWLDARGLHLRWHDGRGGLDLRTDQIVWGQDASTFDVTVAGCGPVELAEAPTAIAPAPPAPEPEPVPVEPTVEPAVLSAGPGLAFVLPSSGAYTIEFWRAFHAACSQQR